MLHLTVPSFVYDGITYTSIGVAANGYLVPGGAASKATFEAQQMPDPEPPNTVLAPFWTDLDGTGAPGIFTAVLTDGQNSWLVVEWRVHVFGTTNLRVFQAWIGVNGVEDIAFAYDPANLPADPGGLPLVVGAEDAGGCRGDRIPGVPTEDLRVASTP